MNSFANRSGLAALLIWGMAGPGAAEITQYECEFEQIEQRGGGWIPQMLIVMEDDQTGEVFAYDPIIHNFLGTPIAAKVSSETKVRRTFEWDLKTRVGNQSPRMFYTFTYYSNGQRAKVQAVPGAYDNRWTGEGSCTVSKAK